MCSVFGHLKSSSSLWLFARQYIFRVRKNIWSHSNEWVHVLSLCVCVYRGHAKEFPQKLVAMVSVWGLDQVPDHSRAIWAIKHRVLMKTAWSSWHCVCMCVCLRKRDGWKKHENEEAETEHLVLLLSSHKCFYLHTSAVSVCCRHAHVYVCLCFSLAVVHKVTWHGSVWCGFRRRRGKHMFYFISCLCPRSDFGQIHTEQSIIVKIIKPTVIKETHKFHKERE